MARQVINKPKAQKMSVSPMWIMTGTLLIGAAFMGYNLKALSTAIHQTSSLSSNADTATTTTTATTPAIQEQSPKNKYSNAAEIPSRKQNEEPPKEEPPIQKAVATKNNNNDDGIPQYHIIFSTGCSAFQDWQSYVLFYHAAKVLNSAQPPYSAMSNTHVTRISSGCNEQDAQVMKDYHRDKIEIMTDHNNFHLYLTPDFSYVHGGKKSYKYFNKPYGTKHWLENALNYNRHDESNVHDDTIVILLDPDQIILKPFTNDFSKHEEQWRKRTSLPYWDKVVHGHPFAQQYGFHNQWYQKTDITKIAKPEEQPSPMESMERSMLNENFAAGPPYIATAHDFYLIADKWAEFGVGTHRQYPNLLAEMFAYCLAAAHLNLPHQIAQSFMISDVGVGGMEGWKQHIDTASEIDVCRPDGIAQEDLPFVLHYCQRYWLGKWFIGKYKLPKDFISCKSPLLKEPPYDLATKYDFAIQPGTGDRKEMRPDQVKRNAFMICHFIRALNEAARFYKEHHCQDDPPNMNEDLIFHSTLEI